MNRHDRERQLAQYLVPVSQRWRRLADLALAELRISNSSGWCLIFLARIGPDARQTDLAQVIGISQPSLVRTLNQLQAAGLLARAPNPGDGRSNLLVITPEGRTLVDQIEAKLTSLRHSLLDGISDQDLETTLRVMGHLTNRIAERRI